MTRSNGVAAGIASIAVAVALLVSACGEQGGVRTIDDGSTTKPFAAVEVGECLMSLDIDGGPENPKGVLAAPCPTDYAPYELAAIGPALNGCPDGKVEGSFYASVERTPGKTATNPNPSATIWCFALNLIPGQCYERGVKGYLAKQACTAPPGKWELVRAVSQVSGDAAAQCAPGQTRYEFPVPVRVACVAPVSQPPS
jgi:hypothetical protein